MSAKQGRASWRKTKGARTEERARHKRTHPALHNEGAGLNRCKCSPAVEAQQPGDTNLADDVLGCGRSGRPTVHFSNRTRLGRSHIGNGPEAIPAQSPYFVVPNGQCVTSTAKKRTRGRCSGLSLRFPGSNRRGKAQTKNLWSSAPKNSAVTAPKMQGRSRNAATVPSATETYTHQRIHFHWMTSCGLASPWCARS